MCTRTGFGLFIGYLSVVFSGIGVILSTCIMGHVEFINYFIKVDGSLEQLATVVRAVVLLVFTIFILMTTISVYFISGIVGRRHTYMLPWMVVDFIVIVTSVVIACFSSSASVFSKQMISVVIQLVIFCTILKLYIDIRRENKNIKPKAEDV